MPRTRTVASGAFGSGVPRLKRPSAGYWPRAKTWACESVRPRPVRFEDAGEADALGMIAAMAERRAAGRRERIHQLVRREALRREPSRRVGEGGGSTADDDRDQHQAIQTRNAWTIRAAGSCEPHYCNSIQREPAIRMCRIGRPMMD